MTQEAKSEVRHLATEAKEQTLHLAGQARDQVSQVVRRQKDQAADRLGTLAGALRDAAGRLQQDGGEGQTFGSFGRYADRAAGQVDQLSGYLRDRDLTDLFHDVERFARRRPDVFLGGTLLAGLLLGRFLKASSERRRDELYAGRSGGSGSGAGYAGSSGFPGGV